MKDIKTNIYYLNNDKEICMCMCVHIYMCTHTHTHTRARARARVIYDGRIIHYII